MKAALAIRRWAGVGVIWDATEPEPQALSAVAAPVPPQVNVTVIVQPGAVLSFGGGVVDPRLIPAAPQQRAAITAVPITEGTGEQE